MNESILSRTHLLKGQSHINFEKRTYNSMQINMFKTWSTLFPIVRLSHLSKFEENLVSKICEAFNSRFPDLLSL